MTHRTKRYLRTIDHWIDENHMEIMILITCAFGVFALLKGF